MKKVLLAMALLNASAWAQLDSSIDINNQNTNWENFKKRSSLSYFSVFAGPSMTKMGNYQINSDGEEDSENPINQWTQISYRYKLSEDTNLIINPRFQYYLADRPDGERVRARSPLIGLTRSFELSEKLSFSGMISTNLFNVEESVLADKQILNPGGFQSLSYKLDDFQAMGLWVWFNAFIYQENSDDKSSYSLMLSPFYEYKASDKGTLRVWVEQYYDDEPNRQWTSPANTGLISYVGYEYALSNRFGIKPYLATNFTSQESTSATSIGAWFFGKIY